MVNHSIIHACKMPCYEKALGYMVPLDPNDPHYLCYHKNNHLYLNFLDMFELEPKFADPIFETALKFLDVTENKVLIHCNMGMSRSASIALVYLAKLGVIQNSSYELARVDFTKRYTNYQPGPSIREYLHNRWDYLMKINSSEAV